jgi:hypothetical protein
LFEERNRRSLLIIFKNVWRKEPEVLGLFSKCFDERNRRFLIKSNQITGQHDVK